MYEKIRLYSSNERFVFEPLPETGTVIELPRDSARLNSIQFKSSQKDSVHLKPEDSVVEAQGILGIIQLLKGPYLIVVTGRKQVGEILGQKIYKMVKFEIIPFRPNAFLTPEQKRDEERYLQMLNLVLNTNGFYFSYSYDITHTSQRIYSMSNNERTSPMWKRADERFFWNRYLSLPFITKGLDDFILPVMMGFVHIDSIHIDKKPYHFALISRRNWKRAGTRYNVRGIDFEGNVANNIETEQILQSQTELTSFVQTRGSIPMFWSQKANLKYKPKPKLVADHQSNSSAFRRHLEKQVELYGNQVLVSLIDHKGSEKVLADAYQYQVEQFNHPQIKYIAFDFHKHCKGLDFTPLNLLFKELNPDVEKNGFFRVNFKTNQIVQTQKGSVRTNCMDNLDRTNLVQSKIARRSLEHQLRELGLLAQDSPLEEKESILKVFNHIWAENGDTISVQYSGTGALKRDVTRTGKRTIKGMLEDGVNSAVRYYLNNFADGFRQDAFDLFLGKYIPEDNQPSPFRNEKNILSFMLIMIIAMMVIVSLSFSHLELSPTYKAAAALFWLIALGFGLLTISKYGRDLVNNPSLLADHHA